MNAQCNKCGDIYDDANINLKTSIGDYICDECTDGYKYIKCSICNEQKTAMSQFNNTICFVCWIRSQISEQENKDKKQIMS